MPQQGFHCIVDFVDVPYERCIECAATQGRCQFTASILRGMADDARERRHDTLSVSTLVGCVRQAYLQGTEEYYQRPDYQWWAYRGSIAHAMVERGAGAGAVAEQRFERELALPSGRTVTITGQPDEIVPARRLLVEYKTTDRPPKQPSATHIAQLNCYRWLIAPRYEIDTLGIVYLSMREVKKAAAPIWPEGQTERFLIERAGSLADALETGTWPAMTEDTWMCRFCPVAGVCAAGEEPVVRSQEPGGAGNRPVPLLPPGS